MFKIINMQARQDWLDRVLPLGVRLLDASVDELQNDRFCLHVKRGIAIWVLG